MAENQECPHFRPFPTYASTSKVTLSTTSAAALCTCWRAMQFDVRLHGAAGLGLQARIERGAEAVLRGICRAQRLQQMRREIRQIVRLGGQRLGQRQVQLQRVEIAGGVQPPQQRIALVLQPLAIARQVHQRGIVGQHRERRGLGPRQRLAARVRSSATPRPRARPRCRRRAHAPRTAPAARPCRKRHLEPQRQQRLHGLGAERATARAPRDVRATSRASCMVSVLPPLTTRPCCAFSFTARAMASGSTPHVTLEALVLEHEQRAAELHRHVARAAESATGHPRRCAPTAACRRAPRPRTTAARRTAAPAAAARTTTATPASTTLAAASTRRRRGGHQACGTGRPQRGGETTSTHCPFNRACCLASYMASMLAPGR